MRNLNMDVSKQRQIAGFLLVLWALICLSNVVFRHSHRMPDGRIVSHVHPYAEFSSKCNFPAHQHTQSELMWLDCISNIPFGSFVPGLTFSSTLIPVQQRLVFVYKKKRVSRVTALLSLRGPPLTKI